LAYFLFILYKKDKIQKQIKKKILYLVLFISPFAYILLTKIFTNNVMQTALTKNIFNNIYINFSIIFFYLSPFIVFFKKNLKNFYNFLIFSTRRLENGHKPRTPRFIFAICCTLCSLNNEYGARATCRPERLSEIRREPLKKLPQWEAQEDEIGEEFIWTMWLEAVFLELIIIYNTRLIREKPVPFRGYKKRKGPA
jgi:hypothetical protein